MNYSSFQFEFGSSVGRIDQSVRSKNIEDVAGLSVPSKWVEYLFFERWAVWSNLILGSADFISFLDIFGNRTVHYGARFGHVLIHCPLLKIINHVHLDSMWALLACIAAASPNYICTIGACRGGLTWPSHAIWDCSHGITSDHGCQEACNADELCKAYDRSRGKRTGLCCLLGSKYGVFQLSFKKYSFLK